MAASSPRYSVSGGLHRNGQEFKFDLSQQEWAPLANIIDGNTISIDKIGEYSLELVSFYGTRVFLFQPTLSIVWRPRIIFLSDHPNSSRVLTNGSIYL